MFISVLWFIAIGAVLVVPALIVWGWNPLVENKYSSHHSVHPVLHQFLFGHCVSPSCSVYSPRCTVYSELRLVRPKLDDALRHREIAFCGGNSLCGWRLFGVGAAVLAYGHHQRL